MMSEDNTQFLKQQERWTCELFEQPYSIFAYLQRATIHNDLKFPDLAASDAYRALLLTDEVDGGEWEEVVVHTLRLHPEQGCSRGQTDAAAPGITDLAHKMAREAYGILIPALRDCGDLRNALVFAERACKTFPRDEPLQALYNSIPLSQRSEMADSSASDVPNSVKLTPLVRREIYAWNCYEPARLSDKALAALNAELSQWAPKLEIRAVDLPLLVSVDPNRDQPVLDLFSRQLGMFAKDDLLPGEIVLAEPSILTANNRLLEPLCDACSAPLPELGQSNESIACPDCTDVHFCSTTCRERASLTYHPAVCGIEDYDVVVKDPDAATAADSLYLLLVVRAIAMAQTQDVHPLDLEQVKYLWGDFKPMGSENLPTLPFDFSKHVVQPIQIMLNMGIDPFLPVNLRRYDTWVLNTLFAKFRGVASAKLNERTLKPDVAAVHPLWCLANHSCAPNVKWSWGAETHGSGEGEKGAMGLIVREGDDVLQWGNIERKGGVSKGREILNHYCDVGMEVQERREWAIGALGGVCRCERCTYEERDETLSVLRNDAASQQENRL